MGSLATWELVTGTEKVLVQKKHGNWRQLAQAGGVAGRGCKGSARLIGGVACKTHCSPLYDVTATALLLSR